MKSALLLPLAFVLTLSGTEASAQQRSVAELWIPAESIEMLPIRDAEKRETVRAAYRPAYRQIGRLYQRTQALTKKRDAQKKRKQKQRKRTRNSRSANLPKWTRPSSKYWKATNSKPLRNYR